MSNHQDTLKNGTLTDADVEALNSLRERGFAVVVWTPEELEQGDLRRQDMEYRAVEVGSEMIAEAMGAV